MASNLVDGADSPLIAPTPEQLASRLVPLKVIWREDASTWAYPTLLELALYAAEHKIPFDTARIEYAGCGTHGLELDWR